MKTTMRNLTIMAALIAIMGLVFTACGGGAGPDTGGGGTVITPVADPPAGTYTTEQTVTITTSTPGASIYITADGSIPTSSDYLYTSPITITGTITLKAIAVKEGLSNSDILTATYFISSGIEITVTSENDNGDGSLRKAITDAKANDTIIIADTVKTINLTSHLPISKNLTIQGNSVIITRGASWTTENTSSQLMYISSGTVHISRVHFKDGRATDNGAAIYNNNGTLTLESCIFSGNQTSASSAWGGAVFNLKTMTVTGCTFYGNSTAGRGGAINNLGGTLTLTGNLFYGNTAGSYPALYSSSTGTVNSGGYNVVDVALGTGSAQSGWFAETGDKTISSLPVSPKTFRFFSGGGAANVITTLPAGYPSTDFYGNAINNGAAAGAVQESFTGSGYFIEISVNILGAGTVNISPDPDEDGLYSGSITLTPTPNAGYLFAYWLVDSVKQSDNPLTLTITSQTKVTAVFNKAVTSSADTNTAGTLRYAINNAQNGDIISISDEVKTIALTNWLLISRSITIEGNGVTITRAASWTTENDNSQLLSISSATVKISRVHFKDGRAADYGAAIDNRGLLSLESCIFSGNRTSGTIPYGGTVYNSGAMTVKGCTFYGNSTNHQGGAIFHYNGTLTLQGNLFYGNIANYGPVVYKYGGTVSSLGYNVVDFELGTGITQSGWTNSAGDKTINSLPISGKTFKLLSGSAAANVITTLPADYPTTDFYGNTISNNAAAGAVQTTVNGNGYYIDLSLNNTKAGTINISPDPDEDGLYSGSTILTPSANSGYSFVYWLVNREKQTGNPLTVSSQTKVVAVFSRAVTVNSSSDTNTAGTLRYAISNAQDGDIIRISGVTTIPLNTSTFLQITKDITIEGNGVILTRSASSSIGDHTQLLFISSGVTVYIDRVHFKDGRATDFGAAIDNRGLLSLESCIFSGNRTTGSTSRGGAILNNGLIMARGCTFYGNSAYQGGAIYNYSAILYLVGNLFYENTASNKGPVVCDTDGEINPAYNVVDVAYGTGTNQSGWTAESTDTTFSALGISGTPFNTTTFEPAAALRGVVLPAAITVFPATDFNGQTRTWPGAPGAVK